MKLLPVPVVNASDRAVGIFQQHLAASDVHHYQTASRLVAVDVADDRLLFGMLFHVHFDFPLLLRVDRECGTPDTVFFAYTGTA